MFIYIFSTFKIDSNDPLCNFAKGFEDFLQIPLQPLMDNLGNRLVLYVLTPGKLYDYYKHKQGVKN